MCAPVQSSGSTWGLEGELELSKLCIPYHIEKVLKNYINIPKTLKPAELKQQLRTGLGLSQQHG